MPDGLWWLPSLIIFGAAAVVFGGAIAGVRRLGRRREHRDLEQGRALEVQAKARIVQADDAVRDAEREVAFVEAEFGAAPARELRAIVDAARGRLREAFLLQQRLDDAEPDSASDLRARAERIDDLSRSALSAIAEADALLADRRRTERGAADELPALRETAARLARRRTEAGSVIDQLATRFDASALAGVRAAASRVDVALAAATEALETAGRLIEANRPAADGLGVAVEHLARADRDLREIERFEHELADAQAAAGDEAGALDGELAAARRERDDHDDADSAARLGETIREVSAVMAARTEVVRDPFADRDRLRAARDRLEVARAAARTARDRLDGARGALGGAIAIAESQLRTARAAIERGGGGVGADARTRLAEAERQLVIALQEPDPVAALDAARRATSRASDAETLAMFDARGGR